MSIERLREMYPWPAQKPDVAEDPEGWFCGENRAVLERRVAGAKVVLELGAWKGMSTRWLCEHTEDAVITVDHWKGSAEHQGRPELAQLYEIFVANCWEHRDRLIPVRSDSIAGMRQIESLGIKPDVIYVDTSHDADHLEWELGAAFDLFPSAHIVGDDWTWDTVKEGVCRVLRARTGQPADRKFVGRFTCYEFFPEGSDVPQ